MKVFSTLSLLFALIASATPGCQPAYANTNPAAKTAPAQAHLEAEDAAEFERTISVGKNQNQKVDFGNKKVLRGSPPCLTWIDPDKEPRAVLLCVHGCGLNNSSYEDFGKCMSKRGIATYAVDVRGFGSWQAAKGRENIDFDGCLYDVHATLKVIHRVHPKLPVYILGESMGGAIALREASMFPELVSGLISSVPAGDRFKQTSTDLRVAVRYFLGPNRKFNIGKDIINQATEKPELKKSWSDDPLAKLNLSPKELLQFSNFCNGNKKAAENLKTIPVLFLQGCGDQLIKPASTFEIFDKLGTRDKQIIAIQNAEHLILEENQFNDPVIDLVVDWIDRPLPKHLVEAGSSAAKDFGVTACPVASKKKKKSESPENQSVTEQKSSQVVLPRPESPVVAEPPQEAVTAPLDPAAAEIEANRRADRAAREAFAKMRSTVEGSPNR